MISSEIIEVLDFVQPYDPVLTGEDFFDSVENRTDVWHPNSSNSVLCLTRWEEAVVVVI